MRYTPKLSSGARVQLLWPIALFRLLNPVFWPLKDSATRWQRYIDKILLAIAAFVFILHIDAESRYFLSVIDSIDDLLSGAPTYIVLIEITFRGYHFAYYKNSIKLFLKRFYADIYFQISSLEPKVHASYQRRLRSLYAVTLMYLLAITSFVVIPIVNLLNRRREFLYKMIPLIDYSSLYVFLPLMASNIVVGILIVTLIFGEICIICEIILHINGRFIQLRHDLERCVNELAQCRTPAETIAKDFQSQLVLIIIRNDELNKFAAAFQKEFSFRIFILYSFSAILLCVLLFKVYTSPLDSIALIFWICAKLLELILVGEIGSTLIYTTNDVSSMYFECGWEQIICRSLDTRENIRLMKMLLTAIAIYEKPFYLSGLNFFNVSLNVVLRILQGAGSYFTCLIALR